MCDFPNGTSLTPGYALAVKYQVLDQYGRPILGNMALNAAGVVVVETVETVSGPEIVGNGVWCPAGGRCATAPSMSPAGVFWDFLAGESGGGESKADQSFQIGGAPLTIVGVGGNPTVLNNTYSSRRVLVNGKAAQRRCGSQKYDPAP
jgi:hypothetical protein